MRVLLRLNPDERAECVTPDETATHAFNMVKSEYNDSASCDDAYLYDPGDDIESAAEEHDLIDGAVHPEEIIAIAQAWNQRLMDEFDRALAELQKSVPLGPNGKHDWLSQPQKIYDLKKAVVAIDGSFYDFAEDVLLVNEANYFTTVLTDEQLAAIIANPELYVCIEVHPK